MIHVRLYADLRPLDEPDKKQFQVESRRGLTVADVVREARVPDGAIGIVVINGRAGSLGSSLAEGDRVAIFPVVSGG